jgi:16S rRNA (guanine(966)-N(2))-methyltransferase RsmD
MGHKRGKPPQGAEHGRRTKPKACQLRIIGGTFRGHSILYHGDPRTRPMKDRVREAAFNLVGPAVRGTLAIDLFAGTGALGLEAVSRGAAGACFLERHFPTAKLIERNASSLGVQDRCRVIAADTFLWVHHRADWSSLGPQPWLVLCSPPYDFYTSRSEAMVNLLEELHSHAPAHSLFVVESDRRFDFTSVGPLGSWDVREYPPAVLGVLEVTADRRSDGSQDG